MTEFPRDLLPLLRCSRDGQNLAVTAELEAGAFGVVRAALRCTGCGANYRIEEGIGRLMGDRITAEDAHEIRLRDNDYDRMTTGPFAPPASGWRSEFSDAIEIPRHLAALEPLDGRRVLEIGCGDGRFTMLMAQLGARVLAVDFSINALRKLAERLPSGIAPTTFHVREPRVSGDLRAAVGLIQADASQLHVAEHAFDRALSATPLDSRDERMAMYRAIAEALTDEGRLVGGVEHDDLTRRLLGLPVARRYSAGGVFIEHFDVETMRREAAPYFAKLRIRPIRPRVPYVNRLPLRWRIQVARAVDATPFLRRFGEILLMSAERPRRPPQEGARRRGSRLVKRIYGWTLPRNDGEVVWEDSEPI